ncbi:MAG: DUF3592 domain-containing protein [Acidobacteriota bacterium]
MKHATISGVVRWSWEKGKRLGLGCLGALTMRAGMLALLVLGVNAVVPAWRTLWFAASGTVVDGVVVGQVETLEGDWTTGPSADRKAGPALGSARRALRALVEFRHGEEVHRIEARTASPRPLYAVGSKVAVVYAPGHPERAALRAELPDVWRQAGWLLVGTFLIGWAVYWWWLMARRPRRARVVKAER